MWKIVKGTPQQAYIANAVYGSMHNYGAAVDVTLFNVADGKRLDMGTPMDFFGPLSQPRLETHYRRLGKLTDRQIDNRVILRTVMQDAGWHMLPIEWWHFDAFTRKKIRHTYTMID